MRVYVHWEPTANIVKPYMSTCGLAAGAGVRRGSIMAITLSVFSFREILRLINSLLLDDLRFLTEIQR